MLPGSQTKQHIEQQQKKQQEPNSNSKLSGDTQNASSSNGATKTTHSKLCLDTKIDKEQSAAFHKAVQEGNLKKVSELLDQGVSLLSRNTDGFTAEVLANRAGKKEIGQLLKKHQQTLNVALWNCIKQKEGFEKIKQLLALGANPAKTRNTTTNGQYVCNVFHLACQLQSARVVELLLNHDPTLVATTDANHRLPIHYAKLNQDKSVLFTILQRAVVAPKLQCEPEVMNHLNPSLNFVLPPLKGAQSDWAEMMESLASEKKALEQQMKVRRITVGLVRFQFVQDTQKKPTLSEQNLQTSLITHK